MTRGPLRVLALAPYPGSAPSTGFRIMQYVAPLEESGVRVSFCPLVTEAEYRAARGNGGLLSRATSVLGGLRRLGRTLSSAGDHDVVWIQRGIAPFLDRWALGVLRRRGVPLVYDFDDAVFLPQLGGRAWLEGFRDPEGTTRAFCRAAAVVLPGNRILADFARGAAGAGGAERVRVLPTVVDTDRYRPRPSRPSGPPVVGWVGSDSTVPYLESVAEPLLELVRRTGCKVVAVALRRRPRVPGVDVDFIPWTPAAELEAFRSLDVGLYPLDDTPWSRGKCGLKALLYLAGAVPCVASPVGVLPDIVRPGETGYLAATPDEWVEGTERLLEDAEGRARMGVAGRGLVERAYSVAAAVPILVQAFRDAADGGPPPARPGRG